MRHLCILLISALILPGFTLAVNADMDWGSIEFDSGYRADLQMGTNGNLSVNGTGVVHYGASQPGIVTITGSTQETLEVRCRSTVKLNTGGGKEIKVTRSELAVDTPVAYGAGSRCNGIGNQKQPAAIVNVQAGQTRTIYVAGRLRVRDNQVTLSGTEQFKASFSGGRVQQVKVTIQ